MPMMVLSRVDRWLSRPAVLAVAVSALLLAATVALRAEVAVSPAPGHLVAAVPVWWAAALVEAVAVMVSLRWPVLALSAAVVAVIVHMNAGYPPLPVDLAAPIALCSTAALFSRRMAVSSLIGSLAAAAGWSSYVLAALHGDLLASPGAFAALSGQQIANLKRLHGPITTPPTAWGGIAVLGLVLVASWLAGLAVRNRRERLRQVEQRAADLQAERDRQARLAVAEERERISRELHDVVAHAVSVIVIQAQGAATMLDRDPERSRRALDTIVTAGRECLAEIRTVFNATDSTLEAELAMEPLPGLARLTELLDRVREAKLPVGLCIEGESAALQPAVDLAAFRIIQEGLTNVLKHAGPAATATVRIRYHPDRMEIEVENKATGYRDGDPLGRGLRGMQERASNLGGQLSVSAANGSFQVKAVLPTRPPL
jgi:signal transduction histidine kinase